MSVPHGRATRLARVRDLGSIAPAEVATNNLRSAIFQGSYVPGEILPLRDIAERAGCRLRALLAYVSILEHDGLIVIRHDTTLRSFGHWTPTNCDGPTGSADRPQST